MLCMTADGWPYGIPMDHVLLDGKLYFHCAKAGKKLEALREDDRVCYTVTGEGQRGEAGRCILRVCWCSAGCGRFGTRK